MKKVYVIKNRYVDSVTLMGVAVELTELPGVTGAESGMGTSQNVDLLTGLDYPVPAGVTKNDLMIALDAEGPEALEAAHLVTVVSECCHTPGEVTQEQIDHAANGMVACPCCGKWSPFRCVEQAENTEENKIGMEMMPR